MCFSRKKKTSNVSSGITAGDLNMLEFSAVFVEAGDLTDVELILPGLAKGLHLGHAWGRSLKAITSVNQGQAGRLVRARWRKVQGSGEGCVTAAVDDEVQALEQRWVFDAVENLGANKLVHAIYVEQTWLEELATNPVFHWADESCPQTDSKAPWNCRSKPGSLQSTRFSSLYSQALRVQL